MTTPRELTVLPERSLDIVRPAVTPEEALKAWAEYQAMKKALATPEDIQQIQGREFLKKSYWRKVERFYRIDLECVKDEHEDTPDGQRIFYATYRASHPSGAHCDGDGLDYATSIDEYHNARATAHCVPLSAQILTRRGFRYYHELAIGEDVLAYSPAEDLCHWTPLRAVTAYPSLPMIEMQTQSFSVRCTPDHSWAVELEGERARLPQRRLFPGTALPARGNLILAAPADEGTDSLSPKDAAILGWLCTDGHVARHFVTTKAEGRIYHNGPYRKLVIDQAKEPFVGEIRELVGAIANERVGGPQTRTFPQGHTSILRPNHRFTLRQRAGNALFERAGIESLHDLPKLVTRLTSTARRAMLWAMIHAEGSRRGATWVFSQTNPAILEIFQLLATLEGYALGRLQTAHEGIGNGPCRRQTLRVHRYAYLPAVLTTPLPPAPAWCPTTDYGTWIMRLDGQVTITGNTRAKNRAISDLVGGGEVSAEEMGGSFRGKPAAAPTQLAEFWCKEHDTAWFMRGNMKTYAHPIGPKVEGQKQSWCNKPSEKAPSGPQATPEAAPALTGDQFAAWCKEKGIDKTQAANLLGAPNQDLKTAIGTRSYAEAKRDMERVLNPQTPDDLPF